MATERAQQTARIEALAAEVGRLSRDAALRERRELVRLSRALLTEVFRTLEGTEADSEDPAVTTAASARALYDLERELEVRRDALRGILEASAPASRPPLDAHRNLGYFQLVNLVVRHAIVLRAAGPRRFIGRAGFVAAAHVGRQEARIEAFIAVLGYTEPPATESTVAGYRKELLDGAFGRELITRKKPK